MTLHCIDVCLFLIIASKKEQKVHLKDLGHNLEDFNLKLDLEVETKIRY